MFDSLADNLGVLEWGKGTRVVNMYETETYANALGLVREGYEMGAIPSDLTVQSSSPQELMANGYSLGMVCGWKPGFDTKTSNQIGKDVVSVVLGPSVRTTSNVSNVMWSIPMTTVNQEKAAELLNMMFGSKEYMDLMAYGIEGTHYQVVDQEKGIIDYPDGVDAQSAAYSPQTGWHFGNQFLNYIFSPDPETLWKNTEEWNNSMEVITPVYGYLPDLSNVSSEVAACNNVVSQYEKSLGTGEVEPDEMLLQFIDALKAAGIDRIVEEKQKQIDEFIAENETTSQPITSSNYTSASVVKPVR